MGRIWSSLMALALLGALVGCHGRPVGAPIAGDGGGATGGTGGSVVVASGGRSGTATGGAGGAATGTGGLPPPGTGGGLGTGGVGAGGGLGTGGVGTGGRPGASGGAGTGGGPGAGGVIGTGGVVVVGTGGAGTGGAGTGGAGTGGKGTGGAGSGGAGTGGRAAGSGGGPACTDGATRGSCPGPEICAGGAWTANADLHCAACPIVSCPAGGGTACCAGFGAFALTAGTFLPNNGAITYFVVDDAGAVADFQFGAAYEIGAIQLKLASELRIRTLRIALESFGDVYAEVSLERAGGAAGALFDIDVTGDVLLDSPLLCFPGGTCPATFDQISIRLRPLGAGPATLNVSDILIGT